MCTICGCGEGESRVEGHEHPHTHAPAHEHTHEHAHEHTHAHDAAHDAEHTHADTQHYGQGPARAHAPGMSQSRMVRIEQDILGKNDAYARANRRFLAEQGILALNLVSSPGSGKTRLLTRSLTELTGEFPLSVIEGDQETSHDAERIRATGARAIQINTGKGCHLDAHQVGHAIESLQPEPGAVLFIENVGNLVCPAAFDLGEALRVVILSVTEGEDKPVKYPDMFHGADLMLLNKIDLLEHVDFDVAQCIEYAHRINPGLQVLKISARSGEGMADWYEWLRASRHARLIGHPLGAAVMGETPRA